MTVFIGSIHQPFLTLDILIQCYATMMRRLNSEDRRHDVLRSTVRSFSGLGELCVSNVGRTVVQG